MVCLFSFSFDSNTFLYLFQQLNLQISDSTGGLKNRSRVLYSINSKSQTERQVEVKESSYSRIQKNKLICCSRNL